MAEMNDRALYALFCERIAELPQAIVSLGGHHDGGLDYRVSPTWPGGCHRSERTSRGSIQVTLKPTGGLVAWCFACESNALRSLDAGLGWSEQGFANPRRRTGGLASEARIGAPVGRHCEVCGSRIPPGAGCTVCARMARTPVAEPVDDAPAGPPEGFDYEWGRKLARGWNWTPGQPAPPPEPEPPTLGERIWQAVEDGDDDEAGLLVDRLDTRMPPGWTEAGWQRLAEHHEANPPNHRCACPACAGRPVVVYAPPAPGPHPMAICDDCEQDFAIGPHTAGLLEADPYQPIRCRGCAAQAA